MLCGLAACTSFSLGMTSTCRSTALHRPHRFTISPWGMILTSRLLGSCGLRRCSMSPSALPKQPLTGVSWPPFLRKVAFGYMSNQPINNASFPSSLQQLFLGMTFNQSINRLSCLLPAIRHLTLAGMFDRRIRHRRVACLAATSHFRWELQYLWPCCAVASIHARDGLWVLLSASLQNIVWKRDVATITPEANHRYS